MQDGRLVAARSIVGGFAALAVACAEPAAPDAGSGRAPRLELGTGDLGAFEPVGPGHTLALVRGCQGLQHVWVALRVWEMRPAPAIVAAELVRARDGARVSVALEVRTRFEPGPSGEYDELTGLALVVPEPGEALGETLAYRVRVTDADARTAGGEARVLVAWDDAGPDCSGGG